MITVLAEVSDKMPTDVDTVLGACAISLFGVAVGVVACKAWRPLLVLNWAAAVAWAMWFEFMLRDSELDALMQIESPGYVVRSHATMFIGLVPSFIAVAWAWRRGWARGASPAGADGSRGVA